MVSRVLFSTALYLMATSIQASQLRGLQESNETLVDDLFEIPDDFRDGEELKEDSKDALQTLGLVLIIAAFVGVLILLALCLCFGSTCGCFGVSCANCCSRGVSEESLEDRAVPGTKNAETEVGENNNSSIDASSDDAEKRH